MNQVLKKLGFKGQPDMLVLNGPDGFLKLCKETGSTVGTAPAGKYRFIVVFSEMRARAESLVARAIPHFEQTGHLWVCYPKGTSKNFKSDLNRNTLAEVMAAVDLEPVSQVAIDDDWSAMRFRHADLIKNMTRKTATTEAGKARIKL